jgi:hypothetical protein
MTKLLERALGRVAELPPDEQDRIARLLLDELESDERWQRSFEQSPDRLAKLAAEARADIQRGEVLDRDPAGVETE